MGDEKKLAWSASKSVSRLQGQQQPLAAIKAVFKADAEKLPAYEGAAVGDAYMLYRIEKITPLEKIDADKLKGLQNDYSSLVAKEDLSAYLASLRARYKININMATL